MERHIVLKEWMTQCFKAVHSPTNWYKGLLKCLGEKKCQQDGLKCRHDYSKIYSKRQRTRIAGKKKKTILKKEEWSGRNQFTWDQRLLDSSASQNGVMLAREQTLVSMEQKRETRNRHNKYTWLIFNKGAKAIRWRNDRFFYKERWGN